MRPGDAELQPCFPYASGVPSVMRVPPADQAPAILIEAAARRAFPVVWNVTAFSEMIGQRKAPPWAGGGTPAGGSSNPSHWYWERALADRVRFWRGFGIYRSPGRAR